jgi:hypothetical protein
MLFEKQVQKWHSQCVSHVPKLRMSRRQCGDSNNNRKEIGTCPLEIREGCPWHNHEGNPIHIALFSSRSRIIRLEENIGSRKEFDGFSNKLGG